MVRSPNMREMSRQSRRRDGYEAAGGRGRVASPCHWPGSTEEPVPNEKSKPQLEASIQFLDLPTYSIDYGIEYFGFYLLTVPCSPKGEKKRHITRAGRRRICVDMLYSSARSWNLQAFNILI
jgi:hypothetical protein